MELYTALIQYLSENAIYMFSLLPGSAEPQVIWGGIVKRLLIAHFIGNISARKISKSVHVCQGYSKPKVVGFFRHDVCARSTVILILLMYIFYVTFHYPKQINELGITGILL